MADQVAAPVAVPDEKPVAARFADFFTAPAAAPEPTPVAAVETEEPVAEAVTDETVPDETVVEEPAGPAFTVLVDGKEVEVSPDEARNGYLRQADYTKKTMAVAEERKAVAAERQQVRDQREAYARVLPQLESALQSIAVARPDPALAASHPQQYVAQKAQYDEWESRMHAVRAEQQRIAQERHAETQAQMMGTLQSEAEALAERLPKWRDPAYQAQIWPTMLEVGEGLGYTREELNNIADHRAYLVLHELALSRKLKAKGQAVVTEQKKTAAPGAPEAGDPRVRALKQQRERFKKGGGKIEDGAALMAAFLTPTRR